MPLARKNQLRTGAKHLHVKKGPMTALGPHRGLGPYEKRTPTSNNRMGIMTTTAYKSQEGGYLFFEERYYPKGRGNCGPGADCVFDRALWHFPYFNVRYMRKRYNPYLYYPGKYNRFD